MKKEGVKSEVVEEAEGRGMKNISSFYPHQLRVITKAMEEGEINYQIEDIEGGFNLLVKEDQYERAREIAMTAEMNDIERRTRLLRIEPTGLEYQIISRDRGAVLPIKVTNELYEITSRILSKDLARRMGEVLKPFIGKRETLELWEEMYRETFFLWYVWHGLLYKEGYIHNIKGTDILMKLHIEELDKPESYMSYIRTILKDKATKLDIFSYQNESLPEKLKRYLDYLLCSHS